MSDRAFPIEREVFTAIGLPLSFVRKAGHVISPHSVGERGTLAHLRSSGRCRSTPGALAPVWVILSQSIYA
jgi:hypothetical protein